MVAYLRHHFGRRVELKEIGVLSHREVKFLVQLLQQRVHVVFDVGLILLLIIGEREVIFSGLTLVENNVLQHPFLLQIALGLKSVLLLPFQVMREQVNLKFLR